MFGEAPHLYRSEALRRGVAQDVVAESMAVSLAQEAAGLTPVLTLGHLAVRSGVPYRFLRDVVERSIEPFDEFTTQKRSGESRTISVPVPKLMQVQRWILRYILDCLSPHFASYAYQKGRSIKQCASQHVGGRWFLKVDFHDFFTNIDKASVYKVFRGAGYAPLVSFELARICTRKLDFVTPSGSIRAEKVPKRSYSISDYSSGEELGRLAQGSPTSGALSNLVCRSLDAELFDLAVTSSAVYTRYSDDVVFSRVHACRDDLTRLLGRVNAVVGRHGFDLHRRKTRIVPPGARHIVLGLQVDRDQCRLTRRTRLRIDSHIYGVQKFGLAAHQVHRGFSSVAGLLNHVEGLLRYARDIEPAWTGERLDRWRVAAYGKGVERALS